MADNANMNALIVAASRRGERTSRLGLIDRLRGTGPLDDDRQERLNAALSDIERAIRASDDLGRDMAEARLDAVLKEARAAREEHRSAEQPVAPPQSGFDGGFRPSGRRRPTPGIWEESAGQLFARAMVQSRVERRERDDDQRIVLGNR